MRQWESSFSHVWSILPCEKGDTQLVRPIFLTEEGRTDLLKRVRLMCLLMAHIKFSIFENIFSGIKKFLIIFSILE